MPAQVGLQCASNGSPRSRCRPCSSRRGSARPWHKSGNASSDAQADEQPDDTEDHGDEHTANASEFGSASANGSAGDDASANASANGDASASAGDRGDGTNTPEDARDGQGPPSDMPEDVPDRVVEIRVLIQSFLDGELEAPSGPRSPR